MTDAIAPGAELRDVDRAAVYLRSVAPGGVNDAQRRALRSLRSAEERGDLDDVVADAWGTALACAEIAPEETSVASLLREFDRWAAAHDRTLEPAFQRRVTESMVGGDRESVKLPLVCVALYDGDELVSVVPHCDGDDVYTVQDCLDALEALPDATTPVVQ